MNEEFLDALHQIEKEKDIPFEVLMETIESALVHAYKKHFTAAGDVHVRVQADKHGFRVFCQKEVAEDVEDEHTQIDLAHARAIDPEAVLGGTIEIEVTPENFGRIAAQTAKQVVVQRIRDAERDNVMEEFRDRIGEVVTGTVQRSEKNSILVSLGKVDAVLPPTDQVPSERYQFNDRLKVLVLDVRVTPRGPQVIVSRTHPNLIRALFELEVPEILEGIVEIQSIAREAGQRSKIAVSSNEERVDPVGACVGHRGARVQSVVNELYDEKVDIVRWSPDIAKFVAESLSPAKPSSVTLNEPEKIALVTMPDTQLSLAIGKAGQNVRLAAKLTGWKIDIRSESQSNDDSPSSVKQEALRVQPEAVAAPAQPEEAPAAASDGQQPEPVTLDGAGQ